MSDEHPNPFEGIRPLSAPHDPEVLQDPDEVEDLDAPSGLLEVDPVDPIKRGQEPEESQPGLDPVVGLIPPD